jgi:hypothetical protein
MQHHTQVGKEYIIEENVVGEDEWQRWQSFYDVRRRDMFLRILEIQRNHLTTLL